MAETLTLAAPIPHPSDVTWDVVACVMDKRVPIIRVTLVSNTGEEFKATFIGGTTLAGLSFINQGKFKVNQGKSLEKWLFEQVQLAYPQFAGIVSGAEF